MDKKVELNNKGDWEGLVIEMNCPEAQGTIVIEASHYGLWITLPELSPDPVALIDLFYNSEEGREKEGSPGPAQIVFYSPPQADDPVGYVQFFPSGTRVAFEQGVEQFIVRSDNGQRTESPLCQTDTSVQFGYPDEI